ncbi:uncharacterized protein BJ212DRAFT_491157 [Suillus subaureus]|uniref:Uncharacterized protein n=1 Tax=Suillus subaureus TaxID=48587 RepID=A0A9P7E5Z9_9AGAM|nr:uncharacterized protein BJ212DRAFT_491157 [Suillus subaureus]KAG1811807.1 hypothetical protein BJ212DRAFT_491157 [Suillus subaureus]
MTHLTSEGVARMIFAIAEKCSQKELKMLTTLFFFRLLPFCPLHYSTGRLDSKYFGCQMLARAINVCHVCALPQRSRPPAPAPLVSLRLPHLTSNPHPPVFPGPRHVPGLTNRAKPGAASHLETSPAPPCQSVTSGGPPTTSCFRPVTRKMSEYLALFYLINHIRRKVI